MSAFLVLALVQSSQGQGSAANSLKNSPGLSVSNPGVWKPVQRGVELRTATLERAEPHYLIDLKLLRFDQRWITPRVLLGEQLGFKSADVKTFAEKSGALVVINASYFDEKGKPLGLLKSAGAPPQSSLSKSSLFTGVFGMRKDFAFITHRDELTLDGIEEAVQAGPLLLSKRLPLMVTRGASRQSRRSLIGIDKDQKVVIAVTDNFVGGLNWSELQAFFDSQQGPVQTVDLLNLDGGGSAQLYVKILNTEQHIAGTTDVPVAIGFFAKRN